MHRVGVFEAEDDLSDDDDVDMDTAGEDDDNLGHRRLQGIK